MPKKAGRTGVVLIKFHTKSITNELWGYSRDNIFTWFKNVVDKPKDFGVSPNVQDQLKKILGQLESICLPSGKEFNQTPAIKPNQHIHRRLNKGWKWKSAADGGPLGETKLYADTTWKYPANPLPVDQDLRLPHPYFSPYDLLGLFLSLMGPESGATKRTFYLPMVALYQRWCHQIAGNKNAAGVTQPAGVGDPAAIFQITWRKSTGDFFLGTSMAGYSWTNVVGNQETEIGKWEEAIKKERFKLLSGWHNIQIYKFPGGGKEWDWDFDLSVTRANEKPKAPKTSERTRFGNCGETYPFINVMGNNLTVKQRKEECFGIALYRSSLTKVQKYDENALLTTGENGKYMYLWPPCDNCKYLLSRASANEDHFNPGFDMPTFRPEKKKKTQAAAMMRAVVEEADVGGLGDEGLDGEVDGGVDFDEDEEKNMFEEMASVHHTHELVSSN